MVEPVDAVVAQAAVRGARRPENFARETVFQLYRLALDQDLFGARRRPKRRTVERVWHFCEPDTQPNKQTENPSNITDRRTDELATARCQRTDLLFDVGGLVLRGARYHARIGESGAQQGAHREHVQASADDRNGQRDAPRQIRAAVRGGVRSRQLHPNTCMLCMWCQAKRLACPPVVKMRPTCTHSKAKNSVLVKVMRNTVK